MDSSNASPSRRVNGLTGSGGGNGLRLRRAHRRRGWRAAEGRGAAGWRGAAGGIGAAGGRGAAGESAAAGREHKHRRKKGMDEREGVSLGVKM